MFSFLRDCSDRTHREPYRWCNFTFNREQDEAACALELEKAENVVGNAAAVLAISRSELFGCAGCDDDAVAEAAARFLNVKNCVKNMGRELAETRARIGEKMQAITSDEYVFHAKYVAARDHVQKVARSVMGAMKPEAVALIGTEVEMRLSPGNGSFSVGDLVAYDYFPRPTLCVRTGDRSVVKAVAVVHVMEDGSYCVLASRQLYLCFDFVSGDRLMKIEA